MKEKMINEVTQEQFYDLYGLLSLPPWYIEQDPDAKAEKITVVHALKDEYMNEVVRACWGEAKYLKGVDDDGDPITDQTIEDEETYNAENEDENSWVNRGTEWFDTLSGQKFQKKYKLSDYDIDNIASENGYSGYKNGDYTLEQLYAIFATEGIWQNDSYGGWNWAKIVKYCIGLRDAKTVDEMAQYIDHIHNAQHNTGTIFTKFPRKLSPVSWIDSALYTKAANSSMALMYQKFSPKVRKIVYKYMSIAGLSADKNPISKQQEWEEKLSVAKGKNHGEMWGKAHGDMKKYEARIAYEKMLKQKEEIENAGGDIGKIGFKVGSKILYKEDGLSSWRPGIVKKIIDKNHGNNRYMKEVNFLPWIGGYKSRYQEYDITVGSEGHPDKEVGMQYGDKGKLSPDSYIKPFEPIPGLFDKQLFEFITRVNK